MTEQSQPLGMKKGARLTNANNEDYFTSTEIRQAIMYLMERQYILNMYSSSRSEDFYIFKKKDFNKVFKVVLR